MKVCSEEAFESEALGDGEDEREDGDEREEGVVGERGGSDSRLLFHELADGHDDNLGDVERGTCEASEPAAVLSPDFVVYEIGDACDELFHELWGLRIVSC